jgi:hypothetical protein
MRFDKRSTVYQQVDAFRMANEILFRMGLSATS